MLRPKKIHTRNLITKKISATQTFPTPIIFLMVCPLIGQTIQPILCWSHQFSPGLPRILPLERKCTSSSSFTTFFLTLLHTYFDDAVYHLFIPLHLHVWLTESPNMRKSGTPIRHVFVCNFGRGLVNNHCQENGINEDNYCNGRIRNLIEETLKMAIVRTWFFVWKKSPAYLFNHEERQNPTEVDLFGQINTCTS